MTWYGQIHRGLLKSIPRSLTSAEKNTMQFSEEQLDVTNARIIQLEKNICILQDVVSTLSDNMKQTQQYLIKLAHHQSEIAKRLSSWPFLAVSNTEGDD